MKLFNNRVNSTYTGFALALLILVSISIASFSLFQDNYENELRVRHSYQVIALNDKLLSVLTEAETAQQGYILTGKRSYLEPFHISLPNKERLLIHLKALTSDNKDQRLKIRQLESLIVQKYVFINEVLELRDKEGFESAQELINSDKGQIEMDAIRHLSQQIQQEEERLLALRKNASWKTTRITGNILIVGTSFSIVLFLSIFLGLYKEIRHRKNNEEQLFIQNEWFTQTLKSLGDGVITTDITGKITMLNKAAIQILGFNESEAIGQHIDKIFKITCEISGDKVLNPALEAIVRNETVFLEGHPFLTVKDGQKISIGDSGAPIHNINGDVIGAVLIFRDVTEKKKAEQELNIFYSISTDMIGIADNYGYFNRINPSFAKILGYSDAEFLSKKFIDYVHPEDVEKTMIEVEKLSSGGHTENFINRYQCKDGNYKWLEWSVTPVGEALFAIARDTTERFEASEQVVAAYNQFYQILESNPVAIIITEVIEGLIKYVNSSFCTLFEVNMEMLIGKNVDLLKTMVIDGMQEHTARVKNGGGREKNMEARVERADGQVLTVIFSVESIEIDNVLCHVTSVIDITTRKKAEEEINRLNKILEKRVESGTAEILYQREFTDEILNMIPTEIAVYDQKMNYLYINPKGMEDADMRKWIIGKNDLDYCKATGADPKICDNRLEAFREVQINSTCSWQDEVITPEGNTKFMQRILQSLDDNTKYILTGYDITQIKEAEKVRQQYTHDIEAMMFITSHKLRHPIAQITGLTTLLNEDLTKDELAAVLTYTKDSITSLDTFSRELTMFIHDLKKKNKDSPSDKSTV